MALYTFLLNVALSNIWFITVPLTYQLFSSTTPTFNMSCECSILQAPFPHYVFWKSQLSLSDWKYKCPFSSHFFKNFLIVHTFNLWYSQHLPIESPFCCLVCSSFVRTLSFFQCHLREQVWHSISAIFAIKSSYLLSFSLWKIFFAIPICLWISVSHFPVHNSHLHLSLLLMTLQLFIICSELP